jgi:hypothetical protein|tara:strand:- start:936 stop:1808 length:873 start_codon:yes stop_codon:yes gene_type:complete
MKIVLADAISLFHLQHHKLTGNRLYLEAYFKTQGLTRMIERNPSISLFLDSGAYSAFTKDMVIDIDKYINFIKQNQEFITQYASLDVIGNAEKTLKNQQYMESHGLNPIPCFHCREDYKYLEYYVDNYDYMALGGVAQLKGSKSQLKSWLDDVWGRYLINDDGTAKIKVHGFGITSLEIMKRYPWYSVDSTSWVLTSRFGSVFCNIGDYNKITVSNEGDTSKPGHYLRFKEWEKEIIKDYFNNLGDGYLVSELANDYKKRDQVNILYFLDLERQLTENVPRYINRQTVLF